MKFKKAMTTAELLIALTIIGVVAALVLPSVIENYQKKIYLTKLKKTYMALTSAVEQACIDSNVSYFYLTPYAANYNKSKALEFLKKYMNVKSESSGFADTYKIIQDRAYTETELAQMNEEDREKYSDPEAKVQERGSGVSDSYAKVMLNDGQALAMVCETSSNNCYVFLDINGKDEPNMEGRDMFSFRIEQLTNKISDYKSSDNCLTGSATIGDVNIGNGGGCLAKIMEDNWNMDY